MTINVTKFHIEAGHQSEKTNPVAIALCAAGFQKVKVNLNQMSFMHNGIFIIAPTPDRAKEWLLRWVNYLPCEDLSFEVEI